MARPIRLEFVSALYHVMERGGRGDEPPRVPSGLLGLSQASTADLSIYRTRLIIR